MLGQRMITTFFKKKKNNKKLKRDNSVKRKKKKNKPLGQHLVCYLTNQQMFQSCGFKSAEGLNPAVHYQGLHTAWLSIN